MVPVTYPSVAKDGLFSMTLCMRSSVFTEKDSSERICPSVGYMGHILIGEIDHPKIQPWLSGTIGSEPGVNWNSKLSNDIVAKCWKPKAGKPKAKPYCTWKEGDQGFVVYGMFNVESTSKSMVRESKIYRP